MMPLRATSADIEVHYTPAIAREAGMPRHKWTWTIKVYDIVALDNDVRRFTLLRDARGRARTRNGAYRKAAREAMTR